MTEPLLTSGTTIGRYVVLDRIGEGAMGVVYAAYDRELDRKIALKVLRANADDDRPSELGQKRLLREAQAMARLSHPNVVSVHDVGTYGDRVFIAMEYIDGETLTQWLARAEPNWRHVLEVYEAAGRGLAAAHAAGLVHRDFKPDNVMLRGDGRVVVMDFGVVKHMDATEPKAAPPEGPTRSPARLTRTDATPGTPAYMAPEQHRRLDADAKTDQFSFCVALYEALYGQHPFAGETWSELAFEVLQGNVRDAPRRSRIPTHIRRILLRGLRVDSTERYPSMDALLGALERHPFRPGRQVAVMASVAVVAAMGAYAYQNRNAKAQLCRGADRKLTGIWDAAQKERVRKAFQDSKSALAEDAWRGVEQSIDQYVQGWVAMRTDACEATWSRREQSGELLDLRMQCLDDRLQETAALVDVFKKGEPKVIERSVEAAQSLTGLSDCANTKALAQVMEMPRDPAVRLRIEGIRQTLARSKTLLRTGSYKQAMALFQSAASEARELNFAPLVAETSMAVAGLQEQLGDFKTAEKSLHGAVEAAMKGGNLQAAERSWALLVGIAAKQEHFDDATHWAAYASSLVDRLGGDEPRVLLETGLGLLAKSQGHYDEAIVHYERCYEIAVHGWGKDSIPAAQRLNNLAIVYGLKGDYARARQSHERALEIKRKALGANHPSVAVSLVNLSAVLRHQGVWKQASVTLKEAARILEQAGGKQSPALAPALHNLGIVQERLEQWEDAHANFRRALAIWEAVGRGENADAASAMQGIATTSVELSRPREAEALMRRALALREKILPPDHPEVADGHYNLGLILGKIGKHAEALEHHLRAIAIADRAKGHATGDVAFYLTGAAKTLLELGKPEHALPMLERALAVRKATEGEPADLAETRFVLARALTMLHRDPARARELAEMAHAAYLQQGAGRERERKMVAAWMAKHFGGASAT